MVKHTSRTWRCSLCLRRYDLKTNKWSAGPNLSEGRFLCTVIRSPLNNGFFVLGGFRNGASKRVEFFNVKTGFWSNKTPLPEPRYLHCSILV
jgi:hypothetical protein